VSLLANTGKTQENPAQKPLALKEWVFDKDGKQIKELIQISFLEFYFTKKSAENYQKACC